MQGRFFFLSLFLLLLLLLSFFYSFILKSNIKANPNTPAPHEMTPETSLFPALAPSFYSVSPCQEVASSSKPEVSNSTLREGSWRWSLGAAAPSTSHLLNRNLLQLLNNKKKKSTCWEFATPDLSCSCHLVGYHLKTLQSACLCDMLPLRCFFSITVISAAAALVRRSAGSTGSRPLEAS